MENTGFRQKNYRQMSLGLAFAIMEMVSL